MKKTGISRGFIFRLLSARPSAASTEVIDMSTGKLILIGCGPGAADLLTLRAVDRIQTSDLVLYDRLVSPDVLEFASGKSEKVYVGKNCGDGGRQQYDINSKIADALMAGSIVARLKSGDPMMFGRATEEIAAATACGARVEIIPGVTAALSAAADARIALTERDEIQNFVMTTARTATDLKVPDWSQMAQPGTCMSFYMGVAQAWRIQSALMAAGVPGKATAQWVERAGQPDTKIVNSCVNRISLDASEHRVTNPAVLIVRYPFSLAATKSQALSAPLGA
jgi:uroporphyrin-III C-methyltransferase/precorrin-2 dehydrogenase/sirohydrochlorin ferrochelatase/uroporphyrin-III C-methyltransferase